MGEAFLIGRSLRFRGLALFFCLWAALCASQGLVAQAPAEPVGPTVLAVEIASDVPVGGRGSVRNLIAIEPGKPLTEDAVRRTLTNLYASGTAGEVEVWSRPSIDARGGEGVVVTVVLWGNVLLSEVRVEGNLALRRGVVEPLVVRGEGQALVESRILRGVYDLQELYERRGYLEAQVRVRTEPREPVSGSAAVIYTIDAGPRATVGEVVLEGDLGPFTPFELIAALDLSTGDIYSGRRNEQATERLRRFLAERDYLSARVDEPVATYDRDTDRMRLEVFLDVGPKVLIEVTGASLEKLQKKDLLPLLEPGGYDEGLVYQSADRIRRWYQQRGYYKATVEPGVETVETPGESAAGGEAAAGEAAAGVEEDTVRLAFVVNQGEKFTLKELRFEGNERFSDEELAKLMTTSPRSLFALGSGRLVDEELEADVENLRAYYALQGFADVEIEQPVIGEQDGELRVVIRIREGVDRRVAGLAFEGTTYYTPKELASDLEKLGLLEAGGAFHRLLLEDSLTRVRTRYREAGFSAVQVSADTRWNADETRVEITFRVLEGPLTLVDRVIVRGNTKTLDRVVERAMSLEPGDAVSEARLLEAQRDLYRMGIFSRAEVSLVPADPGSTTRDVLARVEEGKTRRVVYGVGYDTEDGARGLVGFSNSNLMGRGYALGTDLRVATRDFQDDLTGRARITFDQPHVGRLDVPVTYTLFYFDETRPSFDVKRYGGRVEVSKELTARDRLSLSYDYRIVEPNLDIAVLREERRVSVSSLIPNLFVDHRDDPVDPTRGHSLLAQLQYAFPLALFGTEEEFLKLFTQSTYILPLGRAGVLAASLRLGGIEPFRDLDPGLPSARVSISERFFSGGVTSHRAFDLDEVGIVDETLLRVPNSGGGFTFTPVGGNGLALLNLDWRFPIAGAIGGVVFADAGNVWVDWRDIDPAEARLGAGVGVRYRSPIGPIQAGIAFKLDRLEFEDPWEIVISVGNPF